jgi:hypothetical protein
MESRGEYVTFLFLFSFLLMPFTAFNVELNSLVSVNFKALMEERSGEWMRGVSVIDKLFFRGRTGDWCARHVS